MARTKRSSFPWLHIYVDELKLIYVIPKDDDEEHLDGPECSCRPVRVNLEDGWVLFLHNSFDGREAVEWAYHVIDNYEVGDTDFE